MKYLMALLAPTLLLGACDAPDPEAEDPFRQLSQAKAPSNPGPPPGSDAQGVQGAAPANGAAAPGQNGLGGPPEGQAPADGAQPPPMGGPAAADFLDADSIATVSGTVSVGRYKGPIQVDFVHLDQPYLDGHRPMLNALRLEEPGEFSISFPKDQGRIQVVTYLDLNDDGLGSGDTQAYWVEGPFKVEDDDIEDLEINIDPSNPVPAPPLEGIKLPEREEGEEVEEAPPPGEVLLGPDGEPMPPPPDRAQPTPEKDPVDPGPVVGEDGKAPPAPEGRDAPKEEANE